MPIANLRKVGGSVMLAVPPAILDALQLTAGSTVALAVEDGRLMVEPRRRSRYTLAELLAQCDAPSEADERSAEEREWLESAPVGREIL